MYLVMNCYDNNNCGDVSMMMAGCFTGFENGPNKVLGR